ncbi:hypothetical protein PMG71_04815 [Roseofilum sp. BLCC_M154]|uniref:Uncharacterized protein n=1 Tax=Roseofilum acuticapitatum BLCC-M154 TaxID=3022444 RepID=A0ABT7AQM6_9CYAN|nr:hypothetical protein [Roseofilum acuticapitatum]MDJ1168739.1 hypothetical protein [Roseofilum acuticapitatum BLCC-M154]
MSKQPSIPEATTNQRLLINLRRSRLAIEAATLELENITMQLENTTRQERLKRLHYSMRTSDVEIA